LFESAVTHGSVRVTVLFAGVVGVSGAARAPPLTTAVTVVGFGFPIATAKWNVFPAISSELVVDTAQNSVPRYEFVVAVTSTLHDEVRPIESVAVKRTVYTPALFGVNVVGFVDVDENMYVEPAGDEMTAHE
jgi:hypothetical protein